MIVHNNRCHAVFESSVQFPNQRPITAQSYLVLSWKIPEYFDMWRTCFCFLIRSLTCLQNSLISNPKLQEGCQSLNRFKLAGNRSLYYNYSAEIQGNLRAHGPMNDVIATSRHLCAYVNQVKSAILATRAYPKFYREIDRTCCIFYQE